MKKILLVVLACFAAVSLAACNIGADHSKGLGDSGVQQGNVSEIKPNQGVNGQQNDPANVINFSDKYPDIEFKCNGVDGIYVNTRSAGYLTVVPNDPECK